MHKLGFVIMRFFIETWLICAFISTLYTGIKTRSDEVYFFKSNLTSFEKALDISKRATNFSDVVITYVPANTSCTFVAIWKMRHYKFSAKNRGSVIATAMDLIGHDVRSVGVENSGANFTKMKIRYMNNRNKYSLKNWEPKMFTFAEENIYTSVKSCAKYTKVYFSGKIGNGTLHIDSIGTLDDILGDESYKYRINKCNDYCVIYIFMFCAMLVFGYMNDDGKHIAELDFSDKIKFVAFLSIFSGIELYLIQ